MPKGQRGTTIEWDAEIINDKENELIAWRSLPNSDIDHAGSVHFRRAPGGRGTEVKVEMEYRPPAGSVGAAFVITHPLRLEDAPHGYEIFNNKEDRCIQVLLRP